jgi:aquaporin Z
MLKALQRHWPEYLMEAAGLGIIMISVCFFATMLEHPASPARQAIPDPVLRRVLMGIAVGLTVTSVVYSPWGKQSGAHLNPSFTLGFFRLGKVAPWDAFFYVLAQFAGGLGGVAVAAAALRSWVADPAVNYVTTVPGAGGPFIAFVAELGISFLLMIVVLTVSNSRSIARWTGVCLGILVATSISLEAPLSGMSMNPARTFGSAVPAHVWTSLWIYFTAPPLGMLLAAELHLRRYGKGAVGCAKLHHQNSKRCIFCQHHRGSGQSVSERLQRRLSSARYHIHLLNTTEGERG